MKMKKMRLLITGLLAVSMIATMAGVRGQTAPAGQMAEELLRKMSAAAIRFESLVRTLRPILPR